MSAFRFFVNMMNYCLIGTETIIHYINNYTFSFFIFYTLSDGLSDTEKLFLLLIHKTFIETVLSQYMFLLMCLVNLLDGHSPICVINKTEFLCTRARVLYYYINYSFYFKSLFSNNQKQLVHNFSFTISILSRTV
jgi:hypothetical protein